MDFLMGECVVCVESVVYMWYGSVVCDCVRVIECAGSCGLMVTGYQERIYSTKLERSLLKVATSHHTRCTPTLTPTHPHIHPHTHLIGP